MPTTNQSKKRVRQNETAKQRNKARKSAVRSQIRKFEEAITAGNRETAEQELHRVFSQLDKAAKTNIFAKNLVSRKKSRLTKKLNALGA